MSSVDLKNDNYVYAHINPNTNKIFYIGVKMSDNIRINDDKIRNDAWKKEVDKIGGFDRVKKEVLYIFPPNTPVSKMRSKEYKFANFYNNIDENYCSFESDITGEDNPNYGNYWTKKQREHLSKKMQGRYDGENNPNYGNHWTKKQRDAASLRTMGKYKGKNNPNSKKCRLFLPYGDEIDFDTKHDMIEWGVKNINSKLTTLKEGIPHKFLRMSQSKFNGIYFKYI